MMNLKTIEKYEKLEEEFYRECIRVCNEMKRYDKHFEGLNKFDLYGDEIECTSDNYFKTIPIEWLTMSDNEFKKYVDELVAEEEAKDLEIKNDTRKNNERKIWLSLTV